MPAILTDGRRECFHRDRNIATGREDSEGHDEGSPEETAMTELLHGVQPQTRSRGLAQYWQGLGRRIMAGLLRWRARRRTRRHLADLEAHMLRDIGVTPAEAAREVRKSFPWRRAAWPDAYEKDVWLRRRAQAGPGPRM
jgi:uncharacterized protein YjiS (DUF1127 family)